TLERAPETAFQQYLEDVQLAVRSRATTLFEVAKDLDLYAWVFIRGSGEPTRHWLRLGTEVVACDYRGRSILSSQGWAAFTMHHTLFAGEGPHGQDNRVLYRLNQPLLEDALVRWERALGVSLRCDDAHVEGVFQHGFRDVAKTP